MATIAQSIARWSPFAIATAMYDPTPGRRKSWFPSVKASLTVRKNHPPAMDIIEFHTRPIAEEETSTVRKVLNHPNRWMRATSRSSAGTERTDP